MNPSWTVARLADQLRGGRTTARALLDQALERITDPSGEGGRAFLKVYADQARAEADHADRLRAAGVVRSVVDGLPISVKDLFDVAGDVTRAGSKVLAGAAPAQRDASAVARLRAAGAVIVGRTNMVEFAFGTTGLNPHYGTPRNPWDRPPAGAASGGRVPGGSSSGAAVARADGMCVMSLGTDTRGSVRLPAALCGITGFKPTAARVPREGAFPLSTTLDSIGPLAGSVQCCAHYDAILAGENGHRLAALPARGLRLLVPTGIALEDLDPEVAQAFERSLARLRAAGAFLEERAVPAFERQQEYFAKGGFAAAEAFAIHRGLLNRIGEYDQRVGKRILPGGEMSAADYIALGELRRAFIGEMRDLLAPFDAWLMPSAPCVAPRIAEVDESDERFFHWTMRILRTVGLVNFLDGCAVSLPCHRRADAPVGLSVCGLPHRDAHILAVARTIEGVLEPRD